MNQELLVYFLPIFLFFLSVILTFIITASVRSSARLEKLKKATELYKGELDQASSHQLASAKESEQRISQAVSSARELFTEIDERLGEIRSYHEDLVDLQGAMATFHGALGKLADETSYVEARTQEVLDASSSLSSLKTLLAEFSTRLDALDASIGAVEDRMGKVSSTILLDFQEEAQEGPWSSWRSLMMPTIGPPPCYLKQGSRALSTAQSRRSQLIGSRTRSLKRLQ